MVQKRGFRRLGRHLALGRVLVLMALACLGGLQAAWAAPVPVTASAEAGGTRFTFTFDKPVHASAKVSGHTLVITFSAPVDVDLGHFADLVGKDGRFVRLSADGRTLRFNLTRNLKARAETNGDTVVLHLGTDVTPNPPTASSAAKAPPNTAIVKFAAGTLGEEAPPPVSKPVLNVSQLPGYTRLAFQFPQPTPFEATLAEGQLTLKFQSNQTVRLTRLRVDPPPRVRTAQGKLVKGRFQAEIKVAPGVSLRKMQEGPLDIVDLVDPPKSEQKSAASGPVVGAEPSMAVVKADAAAAQKLAEAKAAENAHPKPQGTSAGIGAPGTLQNLITFGAIDTSALDADAKSARQTASANTRVEDELYNPPEVAAPSAAKTADGKAETAPDPGELAAEAAMQTPPMKLAATVTLGSNAMRISFPWGKPIPAAVVRRGERLWIAFAKKGDIDLSALAPLKDQGVLSYGVFPAQGATVVGLKLEQSLLATAIPSKSGWTIALGNSVLQTAPDVKFEPRTQTAKAELAVAVDGTIKLAHFRDADVQDDLIFVMTGPKPEGLVTTRHYVDFDALASTQGLAIRPISDGVNVRIEPGYAVISRPGGLALSGARLSSGAVYDAPKPSKVSPADMRFTKWRGKPGVPFEVGNAKWLLRVAMANDKTRPKAELDQARYLVAYDLPQEALGVLSKMAVETPPVTSDPRFRILRGVANLMAHRIKDAKKDLNAQFLPKDPYAHLWLAMLNAAEHNWSNARVLFNKAEPAIAKLPPDWQVRARLAATQAALGVNDVNAARLQLEFLPREGLTSAQAAQEKFLKARLLEAQGDRDKALAAYQKSAKSPIEPVAVKAELARVRLAVKLHKMPVNQAVDRLEELRFRWRGDQTEADTLLALGQLYERIGDYRHALTTMRIAVRNFPGTPLERENMDEMYHLFEQLYLGGKADKMPPIQALALYYDFKELTPIGPKGDLMIRKLSDRLVAMDLLDQASALLKYQVYNRLRGVARSQVAARLALVQLMNHKPEDALRTINRTRQARLPDTIERQRRLIQARAFMDIKSYDNALDVISTDTGPAFDRLRADIYWHAGEWDKAGPALEQGLGKAWQGPAPLSDGQQFDVMRAAISFELGGDTKDLADLATKYAKKMANTPDAHGFAVVTSNPDRGNMELQSLTEKFAGIDTLSAFLSDLKTDVPNPKGDTAAIN